MDARILPPSFCEVYEALYVVALSDGGVDGGNHPLNGSAAEVDVATGKVPGNRLAGGWRTNSGQADIVGLRKAGTGKAAKMVGKTAKTMRDERMWEYRVKIDKRLRRLAREMRDVLEGVDIGHAARRICAGRCHRLGDFDWKFCSNCGGPMRELDESDGSAGS